MFALFGLLGLFASGLIANAMMGDEEDGASDEEADDAVAESDESAPAARSTLFDDPAVEDVLDDESPDPYGDTVEDDPDPVLSEPSGDVPTWDQQDTDDPAGMPWSDDSPDAPDDAVFVVGTAGADIVNGGSGNDSLAGEAGNDALSGAGGNDSLWGGNGRDDLDGGAGDDLLDGGDGDDRVVAGDGNDGLTGGGGNDHLAAQSGDDLAVGGAGDDTLLGGEGNDTLFGDEGADWLHGAAGDDSLVGGDGSDTLDGGEGNDTLDGGTGADFLNAGDGDDVLRLTEDTYATGGAGADAFELAVPGTSVIADYVAGEDSLTVVYPAGDGVTPPAVSVQDDGGDALILSNGVVLARVLGAAGLTADAVTLRAQ